MIAMNINKLKNVLVGFYNDDKIKSILIDGPWGCGKTYTIKEFIKDKNSICYVSLFGIKNVEELNSLIYKTVNTNKIVSKGSFNSISKIVSPLSYTIYANPDVLQKIEDAENPIIILDDLERTENSFSFIELFGYIDKFINAGVRVICCYSKSNLIKDKKEAFVFLEKIFDRIFVITGTNEDFVKTLIPKDIDLDFSYFYKNMKMFFNINLRAYIKTMQFYNYFANNTANLNNETKITLLYNAAYIIRIVFYPENYKIYGKIDFSKTDESYYGEDIAKQIKYLTMHKDIYGKLNISYFYGLLDLFLFENFENITNALKTQEDDKKDDLSDEEFINFFLLSDDEKNKYIQIFIKKIQRDKNYFDNPGNKQILFDVLRFKTRVLNKNEVRIICKGITDSKNSNNLLHDLNKLGLNNEEQLLTKLNQQCLSIINDNLSNLIMRAIKQKNYEKLNELFIELNDKQEYMDYFLEKLRKYNFMLPNLAKTLTDAEWEYCNKLARNIFNSGNIKIKNAFNRKLLSVENNNSEYSQSLIERIEALRDVGYAEVY